MTLVQSFWVILVAIVLNSALLTENAISSCQREEKLIDNNYIGACGYSSSQSFTLNTDTFITRVRVWYYSLSGDNNYVLKDSKGNIISTTLTSGGCYANWCERFLNVNRVLSAGTYYAVGNSSNICSDPSGRTTLVVYGCTTSSEVPSAMVVSCDLNGDGKHDIIHKDAQGNMRYSTSLTSWTNLPGKLEKYIACGDLNGDKKDDIIGVNSSNQIYYTLNLGSSWQNVPGALSKIFVSDYNGDGRADILGLNQANNIYVSYNLSTFSQIPGSLVDVTPGNFNLNRAGNEFAGINSAGQIYYTNDFYNFIPVPGELAKVFSGEINGDGRADLMGLNSRNQIYYSTDLRTWTFIPGSLAYIATGDLDGNGINDLVGFNSNGDIYYTLNRYSWANIPGKLNNLITADVNGDKRADVIGIGGDGQVYYTTDLKNWNIVGQGPSQPPQIFNVPTTGGNYSVENMNIKIPSGTFSQTTKVAVTPLPPDSRLLQSAQPLTKAFQFEIEGPLLKPIEILFPASIAGSETVFAAIESNNDFRKSFSSSTHGVRLVDVSRVDNQLLVKISPNTPQNQIMANFINASSEGIVFQTTNTKFSFTVYMVTGYAMKSSTHFNIRYPAKKCNSLIIDEYLKYSEEAYSKLTKDLGFDPSGIYMPWTRFTMDVVDMVDYGELSYHKWTLGIFDNLVLSLTLNEQYCNDWSQNSTMKATIGHEFFHAIQNSYEPSHGLLEAIWGTRALCLFDASSSWFEGEMLGDPTYLKGPAYDNTYINPYYTKGLGYGCKTDPKYFGYGMSTFMRYLTDKYGNGIMLSIWQNVKSGAGYWVPIDHIKQANIRIGDEWENFAKNFLSGNTYYESPAADKKFQLEKGKSLTLQDDLYQLSAVKYLLDFNNLLGTGTTTKPTCKITQKDGLYTTTYIYDRNKEIKKLNYQSEFNLKIEQRFYNLILIDTDTSDMVKNGMRYGGKNSFKIEINCGPIITSISPVTGKPQDQITVTGEGFGTSNDTRELYFGTRKISDVTWSSDGKQAQFKVPSDAQAGDYDVKVVVNGAESNSVVFKIIAQCGVTQQAGGDTPSTRTIELGKPSGTFKFFYNTYDIKDQILIIYEGKTIFDTGCVGQSATQNITYSGKSTQVTVRVIPNCAGTTGTAWNYTVYCP